MIWISSTIFFLLFISWLTKKLHHTLGLLTIVCLCFGIFLGFFHETPSEKVIKIFAELTLVLFLFIDGTRVHVPKMVHYHREAFKQLTGGFLIQCILGAFFAYFLLDLSLFSSFLISTTLAAIDTKVAPAVIENPTIPPRISGILHLESSVTPLLTVFLVVILQGISFFNLLLGLFAGVLTGLLCVVITRWTLKCHLSHRTFLVSSLFLAPFALYYLCIVLRLNGLVAVMALSLTLGHMGRSLCDGLFDFERRQGKLVFFIFIIFIGMQVLHVLAYTLSLRMILYGVGVLFFVRFVAISATLIQSKFKWRTYVFCSFFGPRAVVPIALALLIFSEQGSLFIPIFAVTFLSLLVHSLFSYPLSQWYSQSIQLEGESEFLPTVSFPK